MGEAATRQVIRFGLPGGYAVLVGIYFQAVYGWAWHQRLEELITLAQSNPITTAAGAVAIGFLFWHAGQYFHQPDTCLTVALPKGKSLLIAFLPMPDIAGEALRALQDVPGAAQALEGEYRLAHGLAPHVTPRRPGAALRSLHAEILDERRDALDAILDRLADTGHAEIVRSWNNQIDAYNVTGACLAALVTISAAAALNIVVVHQHAFASHLRTSLEVTALSILFFVATWKLFTTNRRNARKRMIGRLRNGLRAWALQQQEVDPAQDSEIPPGETTIGHPRPRALPLSELRIHRSLEIDADP
jgi:hypothetical protein